MYQRKIRRYKNRNVTNQGAEFTNCLFDFWVCVSLFPVGAYFDSTVMMSTQISWMLSTVHILVVPFWRWFLLYRQSSSFWFVTQQIQFR